MDPRKSGSPDRPPGEAVITPGFRLPAILISPYAKKGAVIGKDDQGRIREQSSVPTFIEDVFGLPRMASRYQHARDDRVGSLIEALDFSQPPRDPMVLGVRDCAGGN